MKQPLKGEENLINFMKMMISHFFVMIY